MMIIMIVTIVVINIFTVIMPIPVYLCHYSFEKFEQIIRRYRSFT